MHRLIQDHLEEVLAASRMGSSNEGSEASAHLAACDECRREVEAMHEHADVLRKLRADVEPRAGFYARVMERIEAQGPISIWSVFSESPFGRRIAIAAMALALVLGLYLVTSEEMSDRTTTFAVAGEDQPGLVLTPSGPPDRDSVLVNLVTYREQ